MRICFFLSSLDCGGAERVAVELCSSWVKLGHEVILVTTSWGAVGSFYEINPKIKLVRLSENKCKKNYFNKIYAIKNLIKNNKPNIVISFLPNVNIQLLISRFFSDFSLIICERSDPLVQPIGLLWTIACKLLYWKASVLVVQTKSVEARVKGLFFGVNNIVSVPNPVPEEIKNHKIKNKNNCKFVYLGRLSKEKNIEDIIYSFGDFLKKTNKLNWLLEIYGDGPMMPYIERLIIDLKIESNVLIMGKTSDPWDVLSSASIFVMASKFEGFPNALLEAMAIGIPCISTDCQSGPAEISDNGRYVKLIPVGDRKKMAEAMIYLANNESDRREMGELGKLFVLKNYSSDRVINYWDKIFETYGSK